MTSATKPDPRASARATARADVRTDSRAERSPTTDRNSRVGLRLDERVSILRDRLEARADTRAANALRDVVREARSHVKNWSPDRINSDTAKRYQRVVQQMRDAGTRPEDAGCKQSFHFARSAAVHDARSTIKAGLRDLDKARRAGDLNSAAHAFNQVRSGLETLRHYPPSTGRREEDLKRSSAFHGPTRPERSNSKRASLSGLPTDWRDAVQERLRDDDRAAVAVMALTGARPSELRGTKVRQSERGDISVQLRGSKLDDARGVKSRTISLSHDELQETVAGRDLADWIGNRDCRTVSYSGSLPAFRERVSRAADRAGLPQVSCYTYRHAEARELKQSGAPRAEIARHLGHRSERSQTQYG
jgi:integrase